MCPVIPESSLSGDLLEKVTCFFAAISVGLRLPSPSSVHRVPSNFTPELIKKRLKGPPEAVSNGHLLAPALDYGTGFRLGSQATAQVPPSLFA